MHRMNAEREDQGRAGIGRRPIALMSEQFMCLGGREKVST